MVLGPEVLPTLAVGIRKSRQRSVTVGFFFQHTYILFCHRPPMDIFSSPCLNLLSTVVYVQIQKISRKGLLSILNEHLLESLYVGSRMGTEGQHKNSLCKKTQWKMPSSVGGFTPSNSLLARPSYPAKSTLHCLFVPAIYFLLGKAEALHFPPFYFQQTFCCVTPFGSL